MAESKSKKKNKMGRPRVEYTPGVLEELKKYKGTSAGTDIQRFLGISATVYFKWRKEHPDFEESIQGLKDKVDDMVENALLKRALGYDVFEHKERSESGGQHGDKTVTETVKKELPPDPGSAKQWLAARRPEWQPNARLELTGSFSEMVEKMFREKYDNDDDT